MRSRLYKGNFILLDIKGDKETGRDGIWLNSSISKYYQHPIIVNICKYI